MKYLALIILLSTLCANCQTKLERINEAKNSIIGTWKSKDDANYKLKFDEIGKMYEFYGDELIEGFSFYEINESCGNNSDNYNIYLKITNNSTGPNHSICEILNSVGEEYDEKNILSITSERGKLEIYYKIN